MTNTRTLLAVAMAAALNSGALAQTARTLSTHLVVPDTETYVLPSTFTLEILSTGILDAAPAVSGAAILLLGQVTNRGSIRAALGQELNGVTIGGLTVNRGDMEVHTLQVDDRLENHATVVSGSYPYPGIGSATPLGSGGVATGVGFGVGTSGNVLNTGSWTSRGDASIHGVFTNRGSFVSANNPGTLPAGPLLYFQQLDIRAGGELRNEATGQLSLAPNSLLRNQGLLTNAGGMLISASTLQVGPGGAVGNTAGAFITLDGGAVLRIDPFVAADLVNGGRIDVLDGRIDNQGAGALEVLDTGSLNVRGLGLYQQANELRNAGRVQVDGRLEGGHVFNQGEFLITGNASVSVNDFTQPSGRLLVDGQLDGGLTLFAGTLEGGGRINGDIFLGGAIGPGQQPPNCHAAGYACFRPGRSPGTMTVDGSVAFGAGSVLELEVERDVDGQLRADLLLARAISFAAGSTIQVRLGAGVGALPQELELLRCEQGCSFGEALDLQLVGGPGTLTLREGALVLSAVPEPAAWVLLLFGIASLRWRIAAAGARPT